MNKLWISVLFVLGVCFPAWVHAKDDWRVKSQLAALFEMGRPSKLSARVATQGMTRAEMTLKHVRFVNALKQGQRFADGTAVAILKREIALLEVALTLGDNTCLAMILEMTPKISGTRLVGIFGITAM